MSRKERRNHEIGKVSSAALSPLVAIIITALASLAVVLCFGPEFRAENRKRKEDK